MQYVIYIVFRAFVLLFALIPFRVLYILSDGIYYLIYYVFKYRKVVVYQNLTNSFPEKSPKEIDAIAKKFYRHLCDIMLESIKGFTIRKKQIIKRYKIFNMDVCDKFFKQNRNLIWAGGHIGNWEWLTQAFRYFTEYGGAGLYMPLSNKYLDAYIRNHRKKFNADLISVKNSPMVFTLKRDKPYGVAMITDQSPSNLKKSYWIKFLNQETAWLHGLEFYARYYDLPVVFFYMKRVKRGHYEIFINPLVDSPKECRDGEITEKFVRRLEEVIIDDPSIWLWSHRRWKHKRED